MSNEDMPQPQIIVRARAATDIENCIDYLEENATPETAARFRAAIADALDQISFMPSAGSPRKVRNPRLPGLRMWVVPNFRN